jgi:hypothetical protein
VAPLVVAVGVFEAAVGGYHSELMDGMYAVDGLLDPEGGAVLREALDALPDRLIGVTSGPVRSAGRTPWWRSLSVISTEGIYRKGAVSGPPDGDQPAGHIEG